MTFNTLKILFIKFKLKCLIVYLVTKNDLYNIVKYKVNTCEEPCIKI